MFHIVSCYFNFDFFRLEELVDLVFPSSSRCSYGSVSSVFCVRDGICVDPPLCRGTSQGKYGSRIIDVARVSETVGKIGEVDEMGEVELVLVVYVRCGKE